MRSEHHDFQILTRIYDLYGYDFRSYSASHIQRRINHWLSLHPELDAERAMEALDDPATARSLIHTFSVGVTDMFRDVAFYRAVYERILPILQTYPLIRIWHAGCATGEEVYSMAMLLECAGLLEKTRLYGTDMNESALQTAREGIYPLSSAEQVESALKSITGSASVQPFANFRYDSMVMRQGLKSRILWSQHNLVSDGVFNEMHLIVCRNVLIYFNDSLQQNTLSLFDQSLIDRGFLALGPRESLRFSSIDSHFSAIDSEWRLFQKASVR